MEFVHTGPGKCRNLCTQKIDVFRVFGCVSPKKMVFLAKTSQFIFATHDTGKDLAKVLLALPPLVLTSVALEV